MKKRSIRSNELVYLGIGLFLMFFYMKTDQEIINYPIPTYIYLSFIAIIALLLLMFSKKQREMMEFILAIIRSLFISWMMVGILLIPFNYYLKYTSKSSPLEQLKCSLSAVSTYSGNRTFFYDCKEDSGVFYGYKPIMTLIKNNNNAIDYKVIFYVRKGAFDTYYIYGWDIVKRNY